MGALVIGVLATYAIVVSGNIRDRDLKHELKNKDESIAKANAQGEEAKAEAAKANLELERLRAPRTLSVEQRLRIIEPVKIFHGTTFDVVTYPGDPEPLAFSNVIAETLVRAGWTLNPNHNPPGTLLSLASGVVVVVSNHAGSQARLAGMALLESLKLEGVDARLAYSGGLQINPIMIAIEIQVAK